MLSNSRFIHIKDDWLPRVCEAMIVNNIKGDIVSHVSKYQIGGMPGHRPAEHLFTVKSVVALYNMVGVAVLIQVYDIKKFFDKESLRDGMATLYKCNIPMKLYRLWFLMNRQTKIQIKTGSGLTEFTDVGEIIGQGSSGGAIVSAANLDEGVREALKE